MADLPATPPTGEIAYRPVSILALCGFALALVFAGLVVLSTLVALIQGLPLFLSGWTMIFAVGGALLSLLALLRIRNSEGTLAGLALARWGLWLSILLGVTYFVYDYVTGLALTIQANNFVMEKADEDSGFLPRLLAGGAGKTELNHAFLLTLPATNRGSVKPDNEERMLAQFDSPRPDGEPGLLTFFRLNPFVQALAPGPKEITITPLGVQDWRHDQGAYQVKRNYRIVTPEQTIDVLLTVKSTEGASEGERRKWFALVPSREQMRVTLTPLGNTLGAARFYSRAFLEKWNLARKEGQPFPDYKEGDTDWNAVVPKKQAREHVQALLADYYGGTLKSGPVTTVVHTSENFSPWSLVDGRLRIVHHATTTFPPRGIFPPYSVGLEIDMVSKDPVDLQQPFPAQLPWEVRAVRITRAHPAPKSKGPGPGM